MNYLSIDYGTRKSGLAYSVESFSFGYKTVSTKDLQRCIGDIVRERKIDTIIIGMPYNIDGTISKHGQRVLAFTQSLEKFTGLPVILSDERLTTSEADLSFTEYGYDGDRDTESARLILERYLGNR